MNCIRHTYEDLQIWRHVTRIVAVLMLPVTVFGQLPAPPQQVKPTVNPSVQNLRVVALAGNGETNDLERRLMAPLVVQVLDREARPVEGADVTFRFPASGPGAVFPNGERFRTVRTNADGQAAATGWTANGVGPFQVQVTATRRNETGEISLTMTNASRVSAEPARRKHWYSSGWFKAVLIAGAAGAVTGIVLATRENTTTVTVSPGVPTIGGGPR